MFLETAARILPVEKVEFPVNDLSYDGELLWLKNIENGTLDKDNRGRRTLVLQALAETDADIKYEWIVYAVVGGVTLASRAAIWGGVYPQIVYEKVMELLHLIDQASDVKELMKLVGDFDLVFSDMVAKKKRAGKTNVDVYKEYIAEHLFKKFSVQQMADELSVNRSHMTRTFVKATGMNVAEYIRNERLKVSVKLLEESDTPLALIAEYLHFASPSQFGVYFKQKYNMTPSEYRKNSQK